MNPTHDQLWSVFPLHHTPHSWLAFDKFGAQLGGLPHTSFTGDKKSSSRMRGSKIIRVHVRLYSILRYKTFRTNLHRLLCALQSDRVTGVALLLSSIDLYRSIFNSVLSSELTVKQIRSISRSTGQQGHVTCDPWPACSQKRCICKRFFFAFIGQSGDGAEWRHSYHTCRLTWGLDAVAWSRWNTNSVHHHHHLICSKIE